MTNLFDFLNDMLEVARTNDGTVHLTPAHRVFIETFLRSADVELHFRATRTGRVEKGPHGEDLPEMVTNYVVRGEGVEVFELLSDAALQNPAMFRLMEGVTKFMTDHARGCPVCAERISACNMEDPGPDFWLFSPPKHD